MKRFVPLSVVASVLACFVLARWAQAAPATGGVLGELTAESHTADRKGRLAPPVLVSPQLGRGWRYEFAPLRYEVLCSRPAGRAMAISGARLFVVGFILWPRPARRP